LTVPVLTHQRAVLRPDAVAAAPAGIASGIHTPAGEIAARGLNEGYTFATVASDLTHLKAVSAGHLKAALGN
jgi:4-hydroxy-2-oxoheptanedioate aldolase